MLVGRFPLGALVPTIGCALLFALASSEVHATVIEVGPTDNYRAAMQALQPGDTLILLGGTYLLSSFFQLTLVGTSAQPITIQGKSGEVPVLRYVDGSQNVLNIKNSSYLILDGIEITGGSRGIRFTGGNDITVKHCHVHHTEANAISTNDTGYDYARFQFIHNEIDHAGDTAEGFYLGCNYDACRIHDSLLEGNYIHDLMGPTVTQGDGIEIKQGSYANIVRDNVIHDTAFPGITVYDTKGHGGINVIERNVVWNAHDNAIQVTGDAVIQNNLVFSASFNAFGSHTIQSVSPANLVVVNNTFVMPSGSGVGISGISGSVVVANNAIYAPAGKAITLSGSLAGVTVQGNAGQGGLTGVSAGFTGGGSVAADFAGGSLGGAPPQNLVPVSSRLVGAANSAYLTPEDFDGHVRGIHADIGAYGALGSNIPGWVVQGGFKVLDGIFADEFDG